MEIHARPAYDWQDRNATRGLPPSGLDRSHRFLHLRSQRNGARHSGRSAGGYGVRDSDARTRPARALSLSPGESEVEAAEQDAAIQRRAGQRLSTGRFHYFGIAALEREGDRRPYGLIAGPLAIFTGYRLGAGRRAVLLAPAARSTAVAALLGFRLGTSTAGVVQSRLLGGLRYSAATAAARPHARLMPAYALGRLLRLGRATARVRGEPLEGHQRGQQPNRGSECCAGSIHDQPTAHFRLRQTLKDDHPPYRRSRAAT